MLEEQLVAQLKEAKKKQMRYIQEGDIEAACLSQLEEAVILQNAVSVMNELER